MNNISFIAIDFETANENLSSVCSLGIVKVENGKIADKKYRLIKPPELRFNYRNIMVHGIKPENVIRELEFYRYWKSLKEYFSDSLIVAHNAEFDIGVLKAVLNRYDLEYPDFYYTCSLRTARRAWKGLSSYSLGNIGKYFGFNFSHHHALEDAQMSADLILRACIDTNSDSIPELNKKLNISFGSLTHNKKHIKVKSNPIK
jgi:DNA polymerase III subunit epsilon